MRSPHYLILKYFYMLFISFCISINLNAQDELKGLWVVEEVKVGEELMTPVAKWFEIDGAGKIRSGNGWLQHSAGTYLWNSEEKSLAIYDSLSLADRYGAFTVEVNDGIMNWTRQEDGLTVKVFAKQVEELPMAPQDLLVGMWKRSEDSEDSSEFADQIYFRWDRNIRSWDDGQRSSGLWNFHAHRPVLLTIINNDRLRWEVEVNSKELVLQGISEGNKGLKLSYLRVDHFPN